MSWNPIADHWRQIKGRLKTEWGNLTGDDLTAIGGTRDQLADQLQHKYGYSKEQAEKACGEFPYGLIPLPISNSSRRSL
jgi:uncharacterized protein YjbJ (UPF0337 family)